MVANWKLSPEQMTILDQHHELIDALKALVVSEEFQQAFGEMSFEEAVLRYEATLHDDDESGWEGNLRERFEAIKRQEVETGIVVDWDNDFDALDSKRRS